MAFGVDGSLGASGVWDPKQPPRWQGVQVHLLPTPGGHGPTLTAHTEMVADGDGNLWILGQAGEGIWKMQGDGFGYLAVGATARTQAAPQPLVPPRFPPPSHPGFVLSMAEPCLWVLDRRTGRLDQLAAEPGAAPSASWTEADWVGASAMHVVGDSQDSLVLILASETIHVVRNGTVVGRHPVERRQGQAFVGAALAASRLQGGPFWQDRLVGWSPPEPPEFGRQGLWWADRARLTWGPEGSLLAVRHSWGDDRLEDRIHLIPNLAAHRPKLGIRDGPEGQQDSPDIAVFRHRLLDPQQADSARRPHQTLFAGELAFVYVRFQDRGSHPAEDVAVHVSAHPQTAGGAGGARDLKTAPGAVAACEDPTLAAAAHGCWAGPWLFRPPPNGDSGQEWVIVASATAKNFPGGGHQDVDRDLAEIARDADSAAIERIAVVGAHRRQGAQTVWVVPVSGPRPAGSRWSWRLREPWASRPLARRLFRSRGAERRPATAMSDWHEPYVARALNAWLKDSSGGRYSVAAELVELPSWQEQALPDGEAGVDAVLEALASEVEPQAWAEVDHVVLVSAHPRLPLGRVPGWRADQRTALEASDPSPGQGRPSVVVLSAYESDEQQQAHLQAHLLATLEWSAAFPWDGGLAVAPNPQASGAMLETDPVLRAATWARLEAVEVEAPSECARAVDCEDGDRCKAWRCIAGVCRAQPRLGASNCCRADADCIGALPGRAVVCAMGRCRAPAPPRKCRPPRGHLILNEVTPWAGEPQQFIEVFNAGRRAVNLKDYRLDLGGGPLALAPIKRHRKLTRWRHQN